MHETAREADRGRPGSAAPKAGHPHQSFEDSQVFADYIALELDKSFVETRGGWTSLLHHRWAPVGSGGSIRQVRSSIQEVMESAPARNAVVAGSRRRSAARCPCGGPESYLTAQPACPSNPGSS